MPSRLRRWICHIAALAALGGVIAAAEAVGLDVQLVIVAPAEVVAGNPINGFVTGNEGWGAVVPFDMSGLQMGPVIGSFEDPIWFSYPTFEYQAPSLVTLRAHDYDESCSAVVTLK